MELLRDAHLHFNKVTIFIELESSLRCEYRINVTRFGTTTLVHPVRSVEIHHLKVECTMLTLSICHRQTDRTDLIARSQLFITIRRTRLHGQPCCSTAPRTVNEENPPYLTSFAPSIKLSNYGLTDNQDKNYKFSFDLSFISLFSRTLSLGDAY